jgi:glycosyltransferase involved in cell wall biosynthesis
VTVVENGTELVDMLSRDQLRSFRIPEELSEVRIVYVGGFKPWHGLNILISAMEKIVKEEPSVRLTLIGHGTQWDEIVQLIHDSNLDHCVELTGLLNIRQVADYLVKSDIAVSPYCGWMEFSGLKLFDYKAAGLAIVASGQDGHPKTLKHGNTGWIVPPCDVDS